MRTHRLRRRSPPVLDPSIGEDELGLAVQTRRGGRRRATRLERPLQPRRGLGQPRGGRALERRRVRRARPSPAGIGLLVGELQLSTASSSDRCRRLSGRARGGGSSLRKGARGSPRGAAVWGARLVPPADAMPAAPKLSLGVRASPPCARRRRRRDSPRRRSTTLARRLVCSDAAPAIPRPRTTLWGRRLVRARRRRRHSHSAERQLRRRRT